MTTSLFFNIFGILLKSQCIITNTLGENAYNAISGFALSNKNYVEAIEVLKQQFNGKDLIVTSHINTLLTLRPLTMSHDTTSLEKLLDSSNANT